MKKKSEHTDNTIRHRSTFAILFYINRTKMRKDGTCQLLCKVSIDAVDAGGGGTIAQYVAMMDVDVVDLGVPILSMHAPFELASKLDVYNTYKAFCAFYK